MNSLSPPALCAPLWPLSLQILSGTPSLSLVPSPITDTSGPNHRGHRPTRVEHVPPRLRDMGHLKTKVMQHCASVNGIEELSGRPIGHIRRDADCQARGWKDSLQGPVEEVTCKPFLRSMCIRIDISRVHSKVRCLHRRTCQFPAMSSIRSNRRTFKMAK